MNVDAVDVNFKLRFDTHRMRLIVADCSEFLHN